MPWSRVVSAWRNLFRKHMVESDLDEEIRAYVEMVTDEKIAAGIPPAQARRAALAEAGGVEQVKQAVREERSGVRLESLWQDVRYGARQLRRNPAFTWTAVVTLGLGIGATTAIFSAVYALLLRPLPYRDAGRLVYVSSTSLLSRGGMPNMLMSPDFVAVQQATRSFDQLAAYDYSVGNMRGAGDPVRIRQVGVTANLLPMLGVVPQLGRLFTDDEDRPGGRPVIVLSDRFWRDHFHADPAVVGKAVEVGETARTIIGVMPRHFLFPSLALEPDIYTAAALDRDTSLSVEKPVLGMTVLGELRPGTSMQQAQAELQTFFLARSRHYPTTFAGSVAGRQMIVESLQRHISGEDRKPLYILLACVLAVLLIACANVANLQLARTVSRRHETALRGALGASRLRLVRQLLVESLLLSGIAAALGLGIALLLTSLIRHASEIDGEAASQSHVMQSLHLPLGKLGESIQLDGWVLAFIVGLALFTTLLSGLAPALSSTRLDLRSALQVAASRISASRDQRMLRHLLLISEVALAVVLLASAGLLTRSLVNVMHYDSGFNPGNTLTGTTLLNDSSSPQQVRTFVDALLPHLQGLPGVAAATVTSALPLEGADGIPITFGNNARPPIATWQNAAKMSITPDYFRVFGTTVLQGRVFQNADNEQAPHVAIVNRYFAKRFFEGDALNKQFRTDIWSDTHYDFTPVTIVGIVDDVRHGGLEQEIKPELFLPMAQSPDGEINIAVRTPSDPSLLADSMRKAVTATDPQQPLFDIQTMDQRVSSLVAQRRLIMLLIACFALLAVVLSAVGVYGVFAYSVSQRSHEMGIRLALGASRRGLQGLIVLQAARLIVAGGVLGLGAAWMVTRLLASMLVGVTPHDAASYALAWTAMTLVALLASAFPASTAARTNLLAVLHTE